ncbi:phage protein Gp27 family protein [Pleomorphomonas koreensis]|uniref:phage protein Gp27 family protein n=1 Tax=Pleomorphomonas koreensis TaxID=257440 RepID=UPI00041152C8|nr:phage protein Gp27 family protein [Pleomorphomonas koreensis]
MAPHTRPRPSSIDLLPEECEGIVAWAAQELANTPRSQTEIYAEFVLKLQQLQAEHRGELEFAIPAFSSFNRHALRLAKLMARQRRAQQIADAVNKDTAGESADSLTQAATRMIKVLIVEMAENANDKNFTPKEALAAAGALRQLVQAEGFSTVRRQKLARELSDKLEKAGAAIEKSGGKTGMSKDIVKRFRAELGIDKEM